jgi:signal transduction histidine kinase
MSRRGPDAQSVAQPVAQSAAQPSVQSAAQSAVQLAAQPDGPERRDWLDAWERLEQPLLFGLPYFALALSVIVVIAVGTGSAAALLADLALAAAAAAWMVFLYTLHPAWRERRKLVSLFLVGLIVLMAVMVLRDPYFGIFTWTGYLYVYLLPLGRWRLLAAAAVAVIAATSQNGGLPEHTTAGLVTYAVLVSLNVLAGCGFTWFASVGHEQDDRRKQLVAELSEANRKLEATLAENSGLHQQLLTQAREAGILDERQRMAREIHDTLAQGLTGIVTQLQAAEQAARRPGQASGRGDPASARQPVRGQAVGPRAAPRAAGDRAARRGVR